LQLIILPLRDSGGRADRLVQAVVARLPLECRLLRERCSATFAPVPTRNPSGFHRHIEVTYIRSVSCAIPFEFAGSSANFGALGKLPSRVADSWRRDRNLRHRGQLPACRNFQRIRIVSGRIASPRCKLPFYERGRKLSVLYKRLPNGYVIRSSYSRAGIMATFYELCDSAKDSSVYYRIRAFRGCSELSPMNNQHRGLFIIGLELSPAQSSNRRTRRCAL